MSSKNNNKIIFGSVLGALFLLIARVCAQTNSIASESALGGDASANIVWASYHQVLNNPASLTVIGFLCVFAWLMDDLPFVNSRYVAHLTVMIGTAIYWLFAGPASVPKTFPYPFVVLATNGTMCGFVAFLIHRQLVARAIQFFRPKTGDTAFLQKPNQNPNS